MQKDVFSGHKRLHGIKFQSLLTPDGLISVLLGPWIGKRHDARMLSESELRACLERFCRDENGDVYAIYGDGGYTDMEFMFSPFQGESLSSDECKFNRAMSGVRIAVEWGFGKVVCLWSFLDFKKKLKIWLSPIAVLYEVAVFLTNVHTCFAGCTCSDYFHILPPTPEQYIESAFIE
jgi:hypothetical protein